MAQDLTRTLAKVQRIKEHLQTATNSLNGNGGSIEEMAAAVRAANELTIALADFLEAEQNQPTT